LLRDDGDADTIADAAALVLPLTPSQAVIVRGGQRPLERRRKTAFGVCRQPS
jgi:hypothetical protein